ncbi:MAG: VOC family protein [Deltaproteobacteria bacterium]|nr:VOC family protein [Deltaproteobacteria bacterium]
MATVAQLGYLEFEVRDLDAWERFGRDVLGLGLARRGDGGALAFRMDGHAERIRVRPGEADDLAELGWELASEAEALAVADRLRAAGVEVRRLSDAEAAARRVAGALSYVDPGGVPSALVWGAELADQPFRSELVRSGFVADEQGLGHIVISARDKAENLRFYSEILGLRLSDHITCDLHGYAVDIAFLHANARHHSVAFGGPQRKRMHHFMLEVRSVDDVGLAMDRTMAAGLRLMQTLGRHPNDRMLSFYAKTPSGFQFELGWGGRQVDDATWEPTVHDRVSEWGHHPPEFLLPKAAEVHQ